METKVRELYPLEIDKYNQLKNVSISAARTYLSECRFDHGSEAENYYQRMVKELKLDRNLSEEHHKKMKEKETIEIDEDLESDKEKQIRFE